MEVMVRQILIHVSCWVTLVQAKWGCAQPSVPTLRGRHCGWHTTLSADETDWHDLRFRGVSLLFGVDAVTRLRGSHAAVLGIGGVGSWVVEGLARSGIGCLTMVDLDDICISNTNRQLHTLGNTVGRPKVEVMAERVQQINPECDVYTVHNFFSETTADAILDSAHAPQRPFNVVVDAIDGVAEKCRLIVGCRRRGIPIVVSGGLGGKADPTQFREVDMAHATGDGLVKRVRSTLRQRYGYPKGADGHQPHRSKKWGLPCVSSPEVPRFVPVPSDTCNEQRGRTCDTGYGTFCPAAGALGFALAAAATRMLVKPQRQQRQQQEKKEQKLEPPKVATS